MWQLLIKLKLVIILAFSLSSCVLMNRHPAEVKLQGIDFVKANPFEQRFIININIKNTTSKPLFVRTLNYRLLVNGLTIASGEQFIWREISGFASEQVAILVSTSLWSQLKPIFRSIKDVRAINYYLTGELTTGNLLVKQISPINHAGTLTSEQLPKDKLDKFRKKIPYDFKL